MLSNEAILHYIWKFKLYAPLNLKTVEGEELQILNAGIHQFDAGPDFYQSKIKIGNTTWVGHTEIHIKSSDWLKHQHQKDKAYDNVILHVVWEHDEPIYRTDGTLIPTLEIKNRVNHQLIQKYEELKQNTYWIPCEKQLNDIDEFTKQQCLDRMLTERLEEKSKAIGFLYQELNGSWEDTFYILMAKSFGFKVNSLPFEWLAKQLSQKVLAKHKDKPLQIEALIFGVSGLLSRNFKDEYPNLLKKEFQFLKSKYNLNALSPQLWKFSKTRPDNFPTIRLSQFAALVSRAQHLFSQLIAVEESKGFYKLFEHLLMDDYWKTHFIFDVSVERKSANLGKSSIDILLINAVAPLLFFYGKQMGNTFFTDMAIKLLENIKSEQNSIVNGFNERGVFAKSAFDSQAIIQLKKYYCDQKKCLNCAIGLKILRA